MSNKIYYSNPYLKTSLAEINEVIEKDGKYHIKLNETIFYPEGGGQPSDTGLIDGMRTLDVYEENDEIFHVLPSLPQQNAKVTCSIDFERRFDHMQQHSGEHLLSGIFLKMFDGHNLGFHLGDDYVTIDISLENISDEMALEVENAANDIIYKNLEIKTYMLDYAEAVKLPLRKKPIQNETLRIVEIDKLDYSACCGTHVSRTGEIGIVKIIRTQKYKGMTRVYFYCGKRALNDFQKKHEMISRLSAELSTGEAHLISKIENDLSELKNKSRELNTLRDKLSKYEATDLVNKSESNLIQVNYQDKDSADIESIARQIMELGDHIVILSSSKDKRVLACQKGNYNLNIGKLFKDNVSRFNGRGGGSDKQAQCTFSELDNLLDFEKFLIEQVEKILLK